MAVGIPDDTGTEPYLGESGGEHPITPADQAAALARLVQEGHMSQQAALALTGGPLTGKRLTALDPAVQLNLVDAGLTPHGGQSEMTGVLNPEEVEANKTAINQRRLAILNACIRIANGDLSVTDAAERLGGGVEPFELEYFGSLQRGLVESSGLVMYPDSEMTQEAYDRLRDLQRRTAALARLSNRLADQANQGIQEGD